VADMTWEIFLGIGALVSFLLIIISPIVKLNNSITELNCLVKILNESMNANEKKTAKQGEEINELKRTVGNCEAEITNLKEKINYFHDL
jgi:chromosome segregation ATPase